MLSAENLASIERDGRHIGSVARAHPGQDVPQYPGWTLSDLAAHLGWIHGRTVMICRDRPTERISGPRCPPDMTPVDWYDRTLGELLEALEEADPQTEVWGFAGHTNLGFWERRMVIETGLHRWDADQSIGRGNGLGNNVAEAGIEEYADTWAGLISEVQPLMVEAVDLGRSWTFGLGEPSARVAGTASDIYLRLMARPSPVALPDDWAAVVDTAPAPPKP